MADVLDKIKKLLRLATSDNLNEARNSAYTAARLIHEHKIVLSLPGQPTGDAPARPFVYTAEPTPPKPPQPPRKAKDLYGHTWWFHEDGPRFGGHCMFCALPLMRGQAAYAGDDGLLHAACWNERQTGKSRPGPAPPPQRTPPAPAVGDPQRADEENAAIDDLWAKIDPNRR